MNLTSPACRPPRVVPWSTRLVVLFGGTLSWLGWVFFGFGMIFVWIFGGKGDYLSAFVLRGKLETATGVVTAVENTRFTEGGGRHSKGTPIYGYHYRFTTDDKEHEGTSYHTGQAARNGTLVSVEFPPDRPDRSRIRGMRRAMFGPAVAFVFLFPIVGLVIVLPGLRQGWKNVRLLTCGESAEGRLVDKVATNVKVNNRTVYKLTFEFTDLNRKVRQATAKTHLPEKLETSHFERLFYDRNDSADSTMFDNLPGNQALTDRGELQPCRVGTVLRTVFAPFVAVAILVGGALVKLLS